MSKGKGKQNEFDYPLAYETTSHSDRDSDLTENTEIWPPIYEPLPEGNYFRILILHPGQYEDDIECDLEIQTHRRAKNKYAAISYVWGDPTDTVEVTCNNFTLSITRNLGQALRQFRHPRTVRRLWADALCINQKNLAEKGHQVGSMGKVFRNAMKVLVWLGDDPEGLAADCFAMIQEVNDYLDDVFERHGRQYDSMPRLKEPHPIPVDRTSWNRLNMLINLPWFQRAWTVQECALAKECRMFWGSQHIDIAEVYEISLWCAQYVDLELIIFGHGLGKCGNLSSDFQHMHCYYGDALRWQESKPGLSHEARRWFKTTFSSVLHAGRGLEATDPRDHFFAFLDCPLAKDTARQSIVDADYFLSKEELWHRVACTLVKHPREGPWLLSRVKNYDRHAIVKSNRPSWVPYWDAYDRHGMLADPGLSYRAGGPIHHFLARPRRGRTLQVDGFIFDSVIWKSAPIGPKEFTLHRFRNRENSLSDEPSLDRLWRVASLAAETLGHKLDEDAFTMTLKASRMHPRDGVERHRAQFKAYCEAARTEYLGTTSTGEGVTVNEETSAIAVGVMDLLNYFSEGKSLFLTREGRLGLGEGDLVEVGDLCCIFSGAAVPFLLTPAANRWHKLVDECYIYGVMHGQLLDKYDPGPILLE